MSLPARSRLLPAILLAGAALTLPACSDDSPTTGGPTQPATAFRRIAVGDNTANTLRLYDASDFSVAQTITTPAPVSYLYPTGSHRYAIYHVRTHNVVGMVDGGVFVDNTLGVKRAAARVGTFADSLPTHGNVNGSMFTVFFDGSNQVGFWNESALAAGTVTPTMRIPNGGLHHGAAIAMPSANWMLTSAFNSTPGAVLPRGINVLNMAGTIVDSARNCPELHGLAANSSAALYGCADGALLVENSGGRPAFTKLAVVGAPDFGVGTVWAWHDKPLMLVRATVRGQPTLATTRKMGIADPAAKTLRLIDLPNSDIDVTGDLDDAGRNALILGRTGTLYIVNGATQQVVGSLANATAVVPATGALNHQIVAADGRAYITNPTAGEVVEVDISTPAAPSLVRRHQVGGQPVRLALLGVRSAAPVRTAQ
jgi:hypothetical protein